MPIHDPISRRTLLVRAARLGAGAVASGMIGGLDLKAQVSQKPNIPARTDVTVYTWSDAKMADFIPMQWRRVGGQAATVLFVPHPVDGLLKAKPADLIANGPPIERFRKPYADYFRWMKKPLTRIILDEEAESISIWNLCKGMPWGERRIAVFREIWDHPRAYDKLPDAVKAFVPGDFATHVGRGREAIIAWEQFAAEFKARALRQCIYEPAKEAFGQPVPTSNYGDTCYDFPVFNYNGWPREQALMGDWCSPSCYLLNRGQRYNNQPKAVAWNNFIDCLNVVRSCLNRTAKVAPWISYPSFYYVEEPANLDQHRWLWRQLVEHLMVSGIRVFLYWNPSESTPPSDNLLAAQALTADISRSMDAPSEPFEPIPLNADEVRTGEKVTKYADWAVGREP